MSFAFRKTLLPLIVLSSLLVIGCRSSKTAVTTSPEATPAQPHYTVLTFSATANGISADGQLRMARDSVIWCSFSKIVELGRAMATPDSVWVNIPLMGKMRKGNYRDLERVTHRAIDFQQLQAIVDGPDTEKRIEELATQMGYKVAVKIKRREQVDQLTFPFRK